MSEPKQEGRVWQVLLGLPATTAVIFTALGAYVDKRWFFGLVLPFLLAFGLMFHRHVRKWWQRWLVRRRKSELARLSRRRLTELLSQFETICLGHRREHKGAWPLWALIYETCSTRLNEGELKRLYDIDATMELLRELFGVIDRMLSNANAGESFWNSWWRFEASSWRVSRQFLVQPLREIRRFKEAMQANEREYVSSKISQYDAFVQSRNAFARQLGVSFMELEQLSPIWNA